MTIHSRFWTMWHPRYLTNCGQAVADAIVSPRFDRLELAHVRLEVHYFNRYLVFRSFNSCSMYDAEGASPDLLFQLVEGLRWPLRRHRVQRVAAAFERLFFGQLLRSD